MIEEKSEVLIETVPATNTKKTVISLMILAFITIGLLFCGDVVLKILRRQNR